MKTAFLKDLGIEKEVIDKIMAENGRDVEAEKAKVTDLQAQLDTANGTIKERDGQLETLKNSPDNPEALKAKITQLQTDNETSTKKHEDELKRVKIDAALEKALTGAKVKNPKAVQALLELGDDVELDKEGNIKGLNEKINELKKSDDYLFEVEVKKTKLDGTKPGEGNQHNQDGQKKESEKSYEDFVAEIEAQNN